MVQYLLAPFSAAPSDAVAGVTAAAGKSAVRSVGLGVPRALCCPARSGTEQPYVVFPCVYYPLVLHEALSPGLYILYITSCHAWRSVTQSGATTDVALAAAGCGGCWTGELPVVDASSAGEATRDLMSMQAINWAGVCDSVVATYNSIWQPFDGVESPRAEAVEHRKLLTYAKYFRKSDQVLPQISDYFVDDKLSHRDIVRTARFKLGSHFLGVETGRFSKVPWSQRIAPGVVMSI